MGLLDRFFGPPSKDKFARLLKDAIQKAGEIKKIFYDQQRFRLHDPEESNTFFLGNAYEEYCSVPASKREETLKRWVRTWFNTQKHMPEDFEVIKPDVLPVVRSRCYFELIRLQLQLQGHDPPAWPYQIVGDDLAVGLVYDLPESMQTISQEHLDDWGVSFYEAMEVARHNLGELQQPFIGPKSGEGLYLCAAKDGYDAARLILLEMIRRFQLKGAPIAMVPNRDTLLVAGEYDDDALRAMLTIAKEGLQELRPISGVALRLDGDDWTTWLPEPDRLLYEEFRTLQIQSFGGDCTEQKELLDKLHEKNGEDIFVPSYSVLKAKESGRLSSYSVWADGVDTLLPITDLVCFAKEGHEPVMVEFETVLNRVGRLMEPLDIYPPRFRITEFPTDEELAALADSAA
jgi:hypothetical protein